MPKKSPEHRKSGVEKTRKPDTRESVARGTRGKIEKVVPKKRNTESPTARVAKGTRERIEAIGLREQFEESDIGQEMLTSFGSLDEILDSEDSLNMVTSTINTDAEGEEFDAILAFFILAAQKNPDYIKGHIAISDFNRKLASAICAKMKWDIKELTKPKSESAVKPAKHKKSVEIANSPEALVARLEKTEVFKNDVINLITCDAIIAAADFPIDWDDAIDKMPAYTVENVMAFLAKNGKRLKQPTISLEDILSNPTYLEKVINRLEWDHDNVDPRHFGAFVLMAAKRNPKLVFDYFSDHTYAEVRDPESKKAIVELLKQSGFPQASAKIFELPPEQEN